MEEAEWQMDQMALLQRTECPINHGEIVMTNERTIEELRAKWEKETPFYYHLDHEGAGILFAEIARLRAAAEPSVTLLPADIDPFLQSITRSPTETLARVEPDWKHRAEEAERILADNMALANRTTRRAMDERNAIIQELRKRYSAAEIADMVGLTRQRVHQILNEAPVESSPNRSVTLEKNDGT